MLLFEERVAWVINKLKEKEGLTNVKIGQKLGVNKNTIAAYSKGKGDLKGVALAGIVKYYGINGEWLIAGTGEPFPGARIKYPEVCGPEMPLSISYIKETEAAYVADDAQKINIDDAMGKTYIILSSGTPYAVALYLNIQQFAGALDTTKELKICQERITNLENHVAELHRQVDRLTAAPSTAEQQADSLEKVVM